MKYLIHLVRFLVGVLFIISGLIKSNDTIGFAYKLEEYYQVFGTEFLIPTAVLQAGLICVVEVLLGITLLLGTRVKLTLTLLMSMIVFFTFLTFYSAYFNKVTDCGCFGDALKLTPWESFSKDVILLVLIGILIWGRKHIRPLFNQKRTNQVLIFLTVLNVAFPIYTYNFLPVIDFRPYAVGKDLLEGMKEIRPMKQGKTQFLFLNLRTNKEELLDNYPYKDTISWEVDTTIWKFIDTKVEILDPGEPAPIHDFSMASTEGSDFTMDILNYPGHQFLLVCYDLEKTNKDAFKDVNAFAAAAEKAGIPFYGLTKDVKLAEPFRHEFQCAFPFLISDGTALKTMIRSNPGLILLKGAKVEAMWHHNLFPEFEKVKTKFNLKSGGPSPVQ